jgi:hypothetical protein
MIETGPHLSCVHLKGKSLFNSFPILPERFSMMEIANKVLRILLACTLFSSVNGQFNESLTKWIKAENVTALGRIFANIAPLGQYAMDGDPGAVAAAPTTENPNYYFQITPPYSNWLC